MYEISPSFKTIVSQLKFVVDKLDFETLTAEDLRKLSYDVAQLSNKALYEKAIFKGGKDQRK